MSTYIGRFAPSPSGPLHLGSLFCALISYLEAKYYGGDWLVRIEDVDETRTQTGASERILETLQTHALEWDRTIVYQSQRKALYEKALGKLCEHDLVYACRCTRQQIKQTGQHYSGHCRQLKLPALGNALRLRTSDNSKSLLEDPIIKRKDGFFAYNLAVVVDDIAQGVTNVVRGTDLLDTTPVQQYIYQCLGQTSPEFLHFPVLVNATNKKLSKQNHAKPLCLDLARDNIIACMQLVGFDAQEMRDFHSCSSLLAWLQQNWSHERLPNQREILISD